VAGDYIYTNEVVEELARHGLAPRADTPPQQLRDAVRDLYKHEIKRLKARLLAREFPKGEYAERVIALRRRYPLLSIPTELWIDRCRGGS
jgi:hypothetical protein